MTSRKILMVAAEVAPLIKIGGLADVVGALPKALQGRGHDVAILMPRYDTLDQKKYPATPRWSDFRVRWQGREVGVTIEETILPDSAVPIFELRCPELFEAGEGKRPRGVYANSDDPELLRQEIQRFVFFSWAVASILPDLPWQPDILHCHDWHAASIPAWLNVQHPHRKKIPSVLTIHNLLSQGRWSASEVFSWLELSGLEHPSLETRDARGDLNLLQLGITAATTVNTVSPTYAKEILTPEYGAGLEATLLARKDGVTGIVNGIDTAVFNPATDPALVERYTTETVASAKKKNKSALQAELGLAQDQDDFLLGFVGRLVEQKGLQLLPEILDTVLDGHTQVVILGSGLPKLEESLATVTAAHPGQVVLKREFNAALAQRIYAGSDAFLMPSKFEPCGLGQLIAMRYGTLPIVRATGGLSDTVHDLTAHPKTGTGFVFTPFTARALLGAIERAKDVFRTPAWAATIHRAMNQDFSWEQSARDYSNLYAKI